MIDPDKLQHFLEKEITYKFNAGVLPILPWSPVFVPQNGNGDIRLLYGTVLGARILDKPYLITLTHKFSKDGAEMFNSTIVDLTQEVLLVPDDDARTLHYGRQATGREWLENLMLRSANSQNILHEKEYLEQVKEYLSVSESLPLDEDVQANLESIYEQGDILGFFMALVEAVDEYARFEPETLSYYLQNPEPINPELTKLLTLQKSVL